MSDEPLQQTSEQMADVAIIALDPRLNISPAATLFISDDREIGAPGAGASMARNGDGGASDHRHLREDGTRSFVMAVHSPLGGKKSLELVGFQNDNTERARTVDRSRSAHRELGATLEARDRELSSAKKSLREAAAERIGLLSRIATVQEDERRRVARELHDGLGQELTALIFSMTDLLQSIPEGSPFLGPFLGFEQDLIRLGRDLHDLAFELRPAGLDEFGLAKVLETLVESWSRRTGIAGGFRALGLAGERLGEDVETAIYRVTQEALNNVAKHSGATRVCVILDRYEGKLNLFVEDDGKGFDESRLDRVASGRSLGLLGMRERAALLGGRILIDSVEGSGTMIRLHIPLSRAGSIDAFRVQRDGSLTVENHVCDTNDGPPDPVGPSRAVRAHTGCVRCGNDTRDGADLVRNVEMSDGVTS